MCIRDRVRPRRYGWRGRDGTGEDPVDRDATALCDEGEFEGGKVPTPGQRLGEPVWLKVYVFSEVLLSQAAPLDEFPDTINDASVHR